jgi:hypothetical protein
MNRHFSPLRLGGFARNVLAVVLSRFPFDEAAEIEKFHLAKNYER